MKQSIYDTSCIVLNSLRPFFSLDSKSLYSCTRLSGSAADKATAETGYHLENEREMVIFAIQSGREI